MPSSRVSSYPSNWTHVSCIAGGFFTVWANRESHPHTLVEGNPHCGSLQWPHQCLSSLSEGGMWCGGGMYIVPSVFCKMAPCLSLWLPRYWLCPLKSRWMKPCTTRAYILLGCGRSGSPDGLWITFRVLLALFWRTVQVHIPQWTGLIGPKTFSSIFSCFPYFLSS